MSQGEEDRRRDEIVLIRRVGEEHDGGHHGGAWKIAYADFMTAMMALFLVMWLVNAASDSAKRQVANYFNPIKLSDSFTTEKGLSEMSPNDKSKHVPKANEVKTEKPAEKLEKEEQKTKAAFSDADFFSDPQGVLAKLAKTHESNQPQTKGEAFRDPFDPAFRKRFEVVNPTAKIPPVEPIVIAEVAEKTKPDVGEPALAKPTWKPTVKRAGKADSKAAAKAAMAAEEARKAEAEKKAAAKKATEAAKVAKAKKLAETLKQKIEGSLAKLGGGQRPQVNIKVTKEGVILSLTDKVGHSMFAVGSAVPKPETVALADTLAAAIKQNHQGRIVISGHTDARAFSGAKYDNWRLSTDRAHAFYRMLERGGVDMARVDRVQGYAARQLKVVSDPNSPLNRRVELTLLTK